MDVLLSRKSVLRKRASLSLLFGSQRPTFATLDDKPTRYYDFVDTPALDKPALALIDRQDIPPELESKIKYACSLLAYRIEQGVPAPSTNQVERCTTRTGLCEQVPSKTQLQSNYPVSKMGPLTGYDSGVGLTQQPSMQTMRVLHSRSDDASESGDTRTVSIFSESNTRTGTSCSNTSAVNSTAPSPKQSGDELQLMAGENVLGYPQHQDCDTMVFLTESSQPLSSHPVINTNGSHPTTAKDAVEVFLDPSATTTTNLSAETLSSHSSPSLGLSRVPAHQYQPFNLRDSYQALEQDEAERGQYTNIIGLGTNGTNKQSHHGRSRSIIIDSHGRAHLLTPDEELQRNKALQQAVLAKMTPGFMKYNPISEHRKEEPTASAVQDGENNGEKRRSLLPRFGFLRSSEELAGSSMSTEKDNGSSSGSKRRRSVLRRIMRLAQSH